MAKGKKAGSDKHENRIQYKGEQSFVYLVGGRLLHRHKVIKTLAYLESRKNFFFLSSFKKTRKSKDPCIIQVPRSPSGKSYENYDPKYNIYEVSWCAVGIRSFSPLTLMMVDNNKIQMFMLNNMFSVPRTPRTTRRKVLPPSESTRLLSTTRPLFLS